MILLVVESDSSAGRLLSLTVLPAAAGESGGRLFVICPCVKTNAFFFFFLEVYLFRSADAW